MTSATAEKKAQELAFLSEWCRAILAFERGLDPQSTMYALFEDVVAQTLDKGDLRGMRMVAKDFAEGARALPGDNWQKLDDLLRLKFGKGLREEGDREATKVARVLKRGKIKGEAEYRLLHERAGQIFADESKKDELESIDALLAAETRKWP